MFLLILKRRGSSAVVQYRFREAGSVFKSPLADLGVC